MFAIAMIDPTLACPPAELSTQGIVSVGVGDWVPAVVESSDFYYAHLEVLKMSGRVIAVLYVAPGAKTVRFSTDGGSYREGLVALSGSRCNEIFLEKRSNCRVFEDLIFHR